MVFNKWFIFSFFLFFSLFLVKAQNEDKINQYEYIIVPESFSFLKAEDEYQLNSLSKFLFNKYGITAFLRGEEMPPELETNNCKALIMGLEKKPGLFLTKLMISLKDCNGNILFSSSEGQSREKDYKKAYHEALRDAFKDVEALNYQYTPSDNIAEVPEVVVQTVPKQLPENLPKDSNKIVKPAIQGVQAAESIELSFQNQSYIFKKEDFGFEILNSQSKSLGKMYKSQKENIYQIKAGDLSGLAYFDSFGNLILERVNPASNTIVVDTMVRK